LLGDTGLLGNDLKLINKIYKNIEIYFFDRAIKWPTAEFKEAVMADKCEIIVNAISSTDYYNEAIIQSIHYDLPIWLVNNKNCKIILFSSDIVNQLNVDRKFKYYANAKRSMENATRYASNCLCIRTSFIGLTKTRSNLIYRLFELNTNEIIDVTNNSYWSGITTTEFYKLMVNMLLKDWKSGMLVLFSRKETLYDFFTSINNLFSYNKKINIVSLNTSTDRSENTDIILPPISEQLAELKSIAQLLKNNKDIWGSQII